MVLTVCDSGHLHCHSHTDNSGAAIGSYLEFRTDMLYAILTSVKIGQFCNSLIPTIS